MPNISGRVAANTDDALSQKKFNVVPLGGAIMNAWMSGATKDDAFGLSIGDRDIAVAGTIINIEVSTDVIDIARDQVIFNEILKPGQLFMPIVVTTEMQYLIHLQYLPVG